MGIKGTLYPIVPAKTKVTYSYRRLLIVLYIKKINKKIKGFFLFVVIALLFHKCVDFIDYLNGPRLKINYIESEYIGEVVRKERTNRANFIKLKTDILDSLKVPRIQYNLFHSIELGDLFIKKANSNYCKVIRNGEVVIDSACFVILSTESRLHWRFPDEWKGKWEECLPYYENQRVNN